MENIKPEISVIIPVYNGQEHIGRCLSSLKKQSFSDFEVLIVNNGSTDNTQQICRGFVDEDKRFKIIYHHHGSAGEARNIGIGMASGRYIAFVDSDDTVLERYLEMLHTAITENGADIAVCGYCVYYKDSDRVVRRHRVKSRVYDKSEAMKELLRDRKMRFYLWNKLWKSDLFKAHSINIPDMYYEDAVACVMLFCYADKVVTTDYCGYSYIRASSSVYREVEMNKTRLNDYINTIPMIRRYLEDMGCYKDVKAPFNRHIFHVFFSTPFLAAQAKGDLSRGVIKNSVSGMGKVIRSCNCDPQELDGITNEDVIG